MGNWLIKYFVGSDDTGDPKVRAAYAKLAGSAGIVTNFLLCALKIFIGYVVSSIAIVADGVNNLTDASSSVLTLIGFKLADKPEDKEHPFGHARFEYLTGVFISVIIIIAGLVLLRASVLKIIDPGETRYSLLMYVILIMSILIKLWQYFFYRKIARAIDSVALRAAAADSRNDIVATGAVLLGMLIAMLTGLRLDGYLGCGVAAFIIISGGRLVVETVSPLLGEAPDPALVNRIITMCRAHDGVYGIHDLMVHNYGPGRVFASVHIEVDCKSDMMEAHDMIDNIENEITEKLGIHFVVHMDPVMLHDPDIEKLKILIARSLKPLDGVLSFHDVRVVPGITHTNIVFDVVTDNRCNLSEDEITSRVLSDLRAMDPTYNAVITFDTSYTHMTYGQEKQ